MRKSLVKVCVLFFTLAISGCVSNEWEKEHGTPELFLESVVESNSYGCYIYLQDDDKEKGEDTNLEIYSALKGAGPFEKTTEKKSSVDKYFTYYRLRSHATSGPNFCYMCVYNDGFIKIVSKSSLGPYQYVYFTMDANKATEIYDLVAYKIPYEKKITEEDLTKAKADGAIDNFIDAMEEKGSVFTVVNETVQGNSRYYNFTDDGTLLDLIKDAEYREPAQDIRFDASWCALNYNYTTSESSNSDLPRVPEWSYNLYTDGAKVRLNYEYIDRIGRRETLALYYDLDATKGMAIINKALEIAKQ